VYRQRDRANGGATVGDTSSTWRQFVPTIPTEGRLQWQHPHKIATSAMLQALPPGYEWWTVQSSSATVCHAPYTGGTESTNSRAELAQSLACHRPWDRLLHSMQPAHRTCRAAQEPHAADALAVTSQRPGRQHGPHADVEGRVAFLHLSRAP